MFRHAQSPRSIPPRRALSLVCVAAALGLLLLVVALAVWVRPARAARWSYFGPGSGLPGNDVQALLPLPGGAVWAATSAGLARYDGAAWQPVSASGFTALAVDSSGLIWAGGATGLLQCFGASGLAQSLPAGLTFPSDDVQALIAGPAGEMWIATSAPGTLGALYHWIPSGSVGGPALVPVELGQTYAVDVDASGRPWWGGLNGLFTLINGTVTPVPFTNDGGARAAVAAVCVLADQSVVLGTWSGEAWFYRSGASAVRVPLPQGFPPRNPQHPAEAILEDARGNVWFAKGDAIRFGRGDDPLDPSRWVPRTTASEDGLTGSELHAIVEVESSAGASGGRALWFGTDLGISVLSSLSWQSFTTANGLSGPDCTALLDNSCNAVTEFALTPDGSEVWVGARAGLSRYRGTGGWSGFLPQFLGGSLLHRSVRALLVDSGGTLWAATGEVLDAQAGSLLGGVQVHRGSDPDTQWTTMGDAAQAPRWLVDDLALDVSGAMWLAARDGLWRMAVAGAETTWTHFDQGAGAPAGPLTSVAIAGDVVLVGGKGVLARLARSTGSWAPLSLADLAVAGADTAEVRDLALFSQSMFAATSIGLVVASAPPTSLAGATVLSAANGFADDIRAVADGNDGYALVASGSGLFRLATDLSRWRRLGAADGLPGEDVLSVVTSGDEFWIGTAGDGAATHSFEMPDTRITLLPPRVVTSRAVGVVTQVEANDPDSDLGQIRFQWRVDGGAWSPLAFDKTITLVPEDLHLADGAHALDIRAVDTEFNEDPTPASVAFELDTTAPAPRIDAPAAGAVLQGLVQVRGAASDARFGRYAVVVWPKGTPDTQADTLQAWTTTPVANGLLATWNTADVTRFPDNVWVLRVIIEDTLPTRGYSQIELLVDNQAPFSTVSSPVLARGDLGATVWSVGGEAQLLVPPFAFAGERVISLDTQTSTESPTGFAAQVGPSELAFAKPATLRLRAPQQSEQDGPLAIFQNGDSGWTRVGGTREVDTSSDAAAAGGTFYSAALSGAGQFALLPDVPAAQGGTIISALATEPRFFSPHSDVAGGRMSISFALARPSSVKAVVYNRAGRLRRELADGRQLPAGQNVLFWDGHDQDGETVATGLYIVCVEAGDERVTQVISVGRQ